MKKSNDNKIFIIIPVMFILTSIIGMWVNESFYIKRLKKIDLAKKAIEVTSDKVDPQNTGKLIFTTGKMYPPKGTFVDYDSIELRDIVVWSRKTETYKKTGSGKSSHYTWSETERVWETIRGSRMGDFSLTDLQGEFMENLLPVTNISETNFGYKNHNGIFYEYESSLSHPMPRDRRLTYSYAPAGAEISVIGEQKNNKTIDYFDTPYGKLYFQADGILTKTDLLKHIKSISQKDHYWEIFFFSIFGLFGMFFLSCFFTKPIKYTFSYGIIAYLLVFATTWIQYNPLYSLCHLVGIVIILLLLNIKNPNKTEPIQDYSKVEMWQVDDGEKK